MATVKMRKISVIGMKEDKRAILKDLMNLGVVEVSSAAGRMECEEWKALVTRDGDEAGVSENEKKLADAKAVIEILMKHGEVKSPMFSVRKKISAAENAELEYREAEYEKETAEILRLDGELSAAFSDENSAAAQIYALTPWKNYDAPLEIHGTDRIAIKLGVMPPLTDTAAIGAELAGGGFEAELAEIGSDKQQHYISLMYFREDEQGVSDILKAHGFAPANIGELQGTVTDNISEYERQIEDIHKRREGIEAELADAARYLEDIRFYHDMINIRLVNARVRERLLNTDLTFTFSGWTPASAEETVLNTLGRYTCACEFAEPEDDDDIPVRLANKSFFAPFEFITKLYSLPSAREVDPTSIFTIFYIMFFGIMFGDVGYGLIIILATFILLRKDKVEGMARKLITVLFWSGVSSAFWGVMFGSYFGDAITVVAKTFFDKTILIKPLWLDPGKSAMLFLAFSCGLGVLHLFVGMGIDAYEKLRKGELLAAVNDDVIWYFIVAGAVMLLFGGRLNPGVPEVGKWMLAAGLALAIILPIFISKGAGKALGLWNIYSGLTGQLSDILSYSRLLGLGLASTSIAQVFNFLAAMGGKSVVGVLMFVLIFVVGHTLNFAINALGAFVHSCRLQFVEFFGKFYEGGGREFEPFERQTKYVKIIEEEK